MPFIKRIAKLFGVWLGHLKGAHSLSAINASFSVVDNLTIRAADGFEIRIYCQKKQVYQIYDKWYIPNRVRNNYRILSVPSKDAPLTLKEACEMELVITELLPDTPNDFVQKEVAINKYVDLLMRSIKKDALAA